jgi:hypothetical protein
MVLAAGNLALQRHFAQQLVLFDIFGVQGEPVDEHLDGVVILPGGRDGLGVIEKPAGLFAILFRDIAVIIRVGAVGHGGCVCVCHGDPVLFKQKSNE